MPSPVQVGTILIDNWPMTTQLDSDPYWGAWNQVKARDGATLDRTIHTAGWNFFFIAERVRAVVFGPRGTKRIQRALKRILRKVQAQHFNGLEVTGIVAKRFLGFPYAIVSAHSRHIQQSCYLDGTELRRTSQRDGEWARR